MTTDDALRQIVQMSQEMTIVDKLGGRESFWGMKKIFEIILKEQHEKDPNEPKEGMYRFKGMEQYGNIVSPQCAKRAIEYCIDKLNFTKEEFNLLMSYYKNLSVDCNVLYLTIKLTLEGKEKQS